MIPFYTAEQSRNIDRYAIKQTGIPGLLLMKRAGLYAFEILQHTYPKARRILVVCGGGNNGGDGFVLAQLAAMAGMKTEVVLAAEPDSLKGDAQRAYREMTGLGMEPIPFDSVDLTNYDVIVDALFGTGLDRPIEGSLVQWIERINRAQKPVLAMDIPSGLQADSGQVLGIAIRAAHTCTFITRKLGLYQYQGPDTAGQVHYSPLFLSKEILNTQTPVACNHSLKYWLKHLPARMQSHHKGTAGTVCLVGGDRSMMGAIQMAGMAALKTGSGLVKVVTHPEHGIALTQTLPELMCYPPEKLSDSLSSADAVGIGPGLGLGEWGKELFTQTRNLPQKKVLDADALKRLAQSPAKRDDWVLTPHPGEAASLLGCSTQKIQENRIESARKIQQQYGGVVVLKGNGTLVYDGRQMELCLAGNPGMAVGGMGDVLTGAISGLLAQGLSLFDAACLGVSLHAHAGDILARQKGEPGLLPTELASTLSQLMTYAD